MRRRAAVTCSIVFLLAMGASVPAGADEGPAQAVEKLHAALVQVAARATALGHAGRVRELDAVVRATHAFDRMASDRMATAWSGLDAARRAQLEDLVARLTVAAYADEFQESESIRFQVGTPTNPADGTVTVDVVVIGAAGEQETFGYELVRSGSSWRIVNRSADGEDLRTQERQAYEALWARGGYPALVAGLRARLQSTGTPPAAATATQVVAKLQDALLGVMREAKQLGYRGRYQRLEPVVRETHYLAAIARLTVRRHWDGWSKAQQKEFYETFARLSVANYASKFDGYSGEQFARVGENQVGKSTYVRSVLTKSNGEKILFDYTMRRVKGRWRILNITVDGVSDLSTKQAEYGSVLASGGLPTLLGKLRDQIRRYESDQ